MRNVCEAQPNQEEVKRRLASRNLMVAVTGVSISVNLALNRSDSGIGSMPSIKNTPLADSRKAVGEHKEQTSFVDTAHTHSKDIYIQYTCM